MLDQYYQSFSDYLRSGDLQHLGGVFPDAENLAAGAVYRNGFIRGCVEALRNSYPVIDALVGTEYFDCLAREYVNRYPPERGSFIGYGEHFPDVLDATQDQHQLDYLSDCARLDRAWLGAFFSSDSILLSEQDVDDWQAHGQEIAVLGACLPESATLLELDHAVTSIWSKLKTDASIEANTALPPGAECVLVWRNTQDQVASQMLSRAEHVFLSTLRKHTTLGVAASAALAVDGDFLVVEYFSELLVSGVLAVE